MSKENVLVASLLFPKLKHFLSFSLRQTVGALGSRCLSNTQSSVWSCRFLPSYTQAQTDWLKWIGGYVNEPWKEKKESGTKRRVTPKLLDESIWELEKKRLCSGRRGHWLNILKGKKWRTVRKDCRLDCLDTASWNFRTIFSHSCEYMRFVSPAHLLTLFNSPDLIKPSMI